MRNLELAAELRGGGPENLSHWLERVGLGHKADSRPGALSGGEKLRLATLRALIGERPVVLLDEPTSLLDEELASRLRNLIISQAKASHVVIATHDQALVAQADRRLAMKDGRLEEIAADAK